MQRRVQLWRFYNDADQPAAQLPAAALHQLLLARAAAGDDLTNIDASNYETQLVPVTGAEPHVELHRIRSDNLPSERRDGQITDLNASVAELAEGSHFLFLPRNLVAYLGTGYSPRPGRLAEWFRARLDLDLWLHPVLRPNAGAILNDLRKVTSVQVRISADRARQLDLSDFFNGEDDPLGALRTAQRAQQGGVITVGWSVGQGSTADQGWFNKLITRVSGADLSKFRSAKAEVYDEGSEVRQEVDFMHDRVAAEVSVDAPAGRQRQVPPHVTLEMLLKAWEQFKDTDGVLNYVDEPTTPPLDLPDTLGSTPAP